MLGSLDRIKVDNRFVPIAFAIVLLKLIKCMINFRLDERSSLGMCYCTFGYVRAFWSLLECVDAIHNRDTTMYLSCYILNIAH